MGASEWWISVVVGMGSLLAFAFSLVWVAEDARMRGGLMLLR
jgi:hypothetical protein